MNERPNKSLTDDITAGRDSSRPAFEPDTRLTEGTAATRTQDFPGEPQSKSIDGGNGQQNFAASRPQGDDLSNATSMAAGTTSEQSHSTLLPGDKAESFSRRWSDIQSTFVDEPQSAVRSADGLVSEVIQELSHRFSQERQGLEHQWSGGGDVSTEDLRMALRHYRDFFQRLLAA